MGQVGVLSLQGLQLHDHYDANTGGKILTIARADSANVRITNAAQRFTAAGVGVWACLKRTVILEPSAGAMTVNYTLTRAGGAGTVHGQARIYRAAALLWSGVDNSTAAGPTVYTDAAIAQDFIALDRLEIWGYVSAGAATICVLEQFEMCWDATITQISRVPVGIPLAITGAGIQYQNTF